MPGLNANGTSWYIGALTEDDMAELDIANSVTGFSWIVRDGEPTMSYRRIV